ncbi:MAG TPA: amino acid adenylation domain-containing protein [Longimicrobiaceae bacterium]|nr:amino acid adenylation domain-containing protein [Longimicrobiaceae bacterium]
MSTDLALDPAPAGTDVYVLPTSFSQQRLWFLDRLEPGASFYNVPTAVRLRGALETDALAEALGGLVERHEILRTTFDYDAEREQPVQVVAMEGDVPLALTDLSALPAGERDAELRARMAAEARAPFDLARGPLIRGRLFRVGSEEHVLLLTLHHIVTDGWSTGVLIREMAALYEAALCGGPSPLPELPIQFGDFAAWQREWLQGETLREQLAYWEGRLGRGGRALSLPTDRPRPPVQTFNGASCTFALPPELGRAVGELARREGCTLFMALLGAFQLLLSRYAGEAQVSVGSPIANRSRTETEGLIGPLINMLVLRTDLSGAPSFREVLARVRETTLGAYSHPDVPFEMLVEHLSPERDLSAPPLFQVIFVLQNTPRPRVGTRGLSMELLPTGTATARADLSLELLETGAGISGLFEYNTDLFDESTVRRMARHLELLLERLVADPDRPAAEVSFLDAEESRRVLRGWNGTEAEYPRDATLVDFFEAQAARTPDAVAAVFDAGTLTYAELDARADRVASVLRRMGAGPETRVAVCTERSPALLAALLGTLKAGAAYVPLDPALPASRIAYVLEDARVGALVTEEHLAAALPGGVPRLLLDAGGAPPAGAEGDGGRPGRRAWPESLAYVIYTSGSTGRPKGVMVPHRTVVNFLESMRRTPGLSASDVLLSVTTLSFDIAVLELLLPLVVGARTVVAGAETAADGRRLAGRLDEVGATVMQATPATWQVLLETGWEGRPQLRMLCGGEALGRPLADALLARGASLWNMYGPTETTVWSAVHRVGEEPRPVPLGEPIANTRLYVLDERLNPVPLGVPGELFIAGEGVARGYLGRPALTAERFVPDPFGEAGARLYRTGDRVRRSADGRLEFLGRADRQVKVRGHRIEPGEIEAALLARPEVREAAVVLREWAPGDERLVAFVAPAPGAAPTAAGVRGSLREQLPEYMVPSHVVVLDALPRTPNGKLDAGALRLPEHRPEAEGAYAPPGTRAERTVAEIWQEVLRTERVGADDNFFDLGGHSLLVVRVQRRLSEAFGRDVPLVDLFQYPTVRALAKHLAGDGETGSNHEDSESRGEGRRASLRQRRERRGTGRGS